MAPARRALIAEVQKSHAAVVEDYGDLHPVSLALMRDEHRSAHPAVRLLLPVGAPNSLFAGMRTAIVFAGRLAVEKDLPLEVVHFDRARSQSQQQELKNIAARASGISADRVGVRSVWIRGSTHTDDIYVASLWETALAAHVAVQAGVLSADKVLYLVQDYEPEFYPGSSESALARATYHAGFRLIVNSAPLAAYLSDREDIADRVTHIFRPELDLGGIESAASGRTRSSRLRVTFYGRPGNTRNSFQLGVASLRVAARRLERAGIAADFVSVGEKHSDIEIPGGTVKALGKLAWDDYFRLLASTDVMLSFQQTPHPSHPPLDAVASGTFAVMNEMAESRGRLSDRLLATDSDPVAVAEKVLEAGRRVAAGEQLPHVDSAFVERLGQPLSDVVADVAAEV